MDLCILKTCLVLMTINTAVGLPSQDNSNLKQDVATLKRRISDIQTHSRSQETKFAALISSILSTITSMRMDISKMDSDLAYFKKDCASTKTDLTNTKLHFEDRLRNMTTNPEIIRKGFTSVVKRLQFNMTYLANTSKMASSQNRTDVLVLSKRVDHIESEFGLFILNADRNASRLMSKIGHLEVTVSSLPNSSVTMDLSGRMCNLNSSLTNVINTLNSRLLNLKNGVKTTPTKEAPVGFQAKLTQYINAPAMNIRFRDVINADGAYNQNNGIYTAPRNGTFLFWVSLQYKSGSTDSAVVLKLQQLKVTMDLGSAPCNASRGVANIVAVKTVMKGDKLFCEASNFPGTSSFLKEWSIFGGLLIA